MDNNLTIPALQKYIELQVFHQTAGEPYTISYTDGLVQTKDKTWQIVIDEEVLKYIKLEEQ